MLLVDERSLKSKMLQWSLKSKMLLFVVAPQHFLTHFRPSSIDVVSHLAPKSSNVSERPSSLGKASLRTIKINARAPWAARTGSELDTQVPARC